MIRARVKAVVQGVIQRITASVWGDGDVADRELMQQYGFTSRPLEGAEVIFIGDRGSLIAIASDDRRYRLEVSEGEAALYDDLGQKVHLTRAGIVVSSPSKITASAPEIDLAATTKITATAPEIDLVASTMVKITSPVLQVTGNIAAGGSVSDVKGSMETMRGVYNDHTQAVSNGTAQAPAARMT